LFLLKYSNQSGSEEGRTGGEGDLEITSAGGRQRRPSKRAGTEDRWWRPPPHRCGGTSATAWNQSATTTNQHNPKRGIPIEIVKGERVDSLAEGDPRVLRLARVVRQGGGGGGGGGAPARLSVAAAARAAALVGLYLQDGEGVRDGVVLLGDAEDGRMVVVRDGPNPLGGGRGGTPGRVARSGHLEPPTWGDTDEAAVAVVATGRAVGEELVVVRDAIG
jgi:hypothetical protein